MNFVVNGRRVMRTIAVIAAAMAIAGAAFVTIPFMPIDAVLAQGTWGAGTPSSSAITAFATARPWWIIWKPEAVRLTGAGGIEPVVSVPRGEIRAGNPVAPTRGFGYDALLGAITAIRSLGSDHLVFDYRLMIALQRADWVGALALTALAIFFLSGRSLRVTVAYSAALITLLALWPPERRFVPDGLIDSALAPACAIGSVLALAILFRRRPDPSTPGRAFAVAFGFGTATSALTMIRGEFFYVNAFVLAALAVFGMREREHFARVGGAFAGLLVFPIAHGCLNAAIFGDFIAFRLQGAQNLFEPIGQYPNPFGILWDDAWAGELLKARGLAYGSREADRFFLDAYLRAFAHDPWLFVTNFARRLADFGERFGWWIGPVWLVAPLAISAATIRRERHVSLCATSGLFATGFLAFCAWTNSMPRLVAPAHAVLLVFFAAAFATLAQKREAKGATPRWIWPAIALVALVGGSIQQSVNGPDAAGLRSRCAAGDARACTAHARRAIDQDNSLARDVRLAPVYFDIGCRKGDREGCAAAREFRMMSRPEVVAGTPVEIESDCLRFPRDECAAWARVRRDAPNGDRAQANRILTSLCLRQVNDACTTLFDVKGWTPSP